MGKHSSKEAYFKRLQELAEVKKPSLKESTRTIGNLIDFKRGADGVAYGIIKENHHYYVKKGGLKENPDASDFTYIGGLGNITEYQYSKLSEADKNRNMILNMVNESQGKKISKDGSIGKLNKKRMLTEEVDEDATQDIEQAEEKLDDLEVASQKAAASEPADAPMDDMGGEEMPDLGGEEPAPDMGGDAPAPEGGEEMPDLEGGDAPAPEGGEEGGEEMPDLDNLDLGGEESGDAPAPEGGEEMPDLEGGEEMPDLEGGDAPAPEGGEEDLDLDMGGETPEGEDASVEELRKHVGKVQQLLGDITDIGKNALEQTLNQVLSGFKEKLAQSEITPEERRKIAKKYIINVEDTEGAEELEDVSAEEEMAVAEEKEMCAECGSFVQYAESRGYTNESILEASNEELAEVAAGYINAHSEGLNEGDFDGVGAHLNAEICEALVNEYGFDESVIGNYQTTLNEMDGDQRVEKINELWGGLKNLGKAAGQGIAKGAQAAGQKAWDATKQAGQAVADKATQAGDWVSKTYHQGEVGGEVKKIEKMANDLGNQLVSLNSRLEKSGQQPINPNSLLRGLANQILAGKQVDISRTKAGGGIQREGLDDAGKVETQPQPGFAPDAQVLGVGVNEGFNTHAQAILTKSKNRNNAKNVAKDKVDANKDNAKTQGINEISTGNESEEKVRKYVRNRLQEMMGLKKPTINENKKSESIKKLDKVIERQFKLYENVVRKKLNK